jgi:peroxiredoxin
MLSGSLKNMEVHLKDKEKIQQAEGMRVFASEDIEASVGDQRMEGTPSPDGAAHPVISGPASRHYLRSFTLPDSAGQPVQLRQYLQRSNVVLFFQHRIGCSACNRLLRELAAYREAYEQEETLVLVIGPDQSDENRQLAAQVGHPFPFLSDPAGRISSQQGLDTPTLVIADRWGEIWAAWMGGIEHRLPSMQDIREWLVFIEAQCPECTIIEWTDEIMEAQDDA